MLPQYNTAAALFQKFPQNKKDAIGVFLIVRTIRLLKLFKIKQHVLPYRNGGILSTRRCAWEYRQR